MSKTNNLLWERIGDFLSMKTPSSRATYRSVIKDWCSFLGEELGTTEAFEKLLAADTAAVVKYMERCSITPGQRARVSSTRKRDGGQSTQTAATISKKVIILGSIYQVLIDCGDFEISRNPFKAKSLQIPKAGAGRKRPTKMLEGAEVNKILTAPDLDTFKGRRDRAILVLLFGAGLRRNEIIGLRVSDCIGEGESVSGLNLRVTKKGIDETMSIPTWAGEILGEYRRERRSMTSPGGFLFPSIRGKGDKPDELRPMSSDCLYRRFLTYADSSGLTNVSPHSARATAITTLLDAGATHAEVRLFSRHATFEMVDQYDKRRRVLSQSTANKLRY